MLPSPAKARVWVVLKYKDSRVRGKCMSNAPRVLVLLSGPIAVGKTTLRDFLGAEHGFSFVRSSTFLLEKARRESLPADRLGLQELGDRLDIETDYRWVVDDVALVSMATAPNVRRWLVDAVRKPRQVQHFRSIENTQVLHAHLTAPEVVLRQRYEARLVSDTSEPSDDAYATAIAHPNEVESRGLARIADIVFDVTMVPASELAEQLMARLQK